MSLHRHAAKRDANEPAIRKRFKAHGWHTETVSQKGMPDLLAFPPTRITVAGMNSCWLVDVKDENGQPTKAQVEKWTELHKLGIPVYVVRTSEDVDALVAGTLASWAPTARVKRAYTPPRSKPMSLTRAEARAALTHDRGCTCSGCSKVDTLLESATEAEVFAPPSLGAEVMHEMLKPPGQEDYAAAVERATARAPGCASVGCGHAQTRHDQTHVWMGGGRCMVLGCSCDIYRVP